MAEFAEFLGGRLGAERVRTGAGTRGIAAPVADKTGLTGRYDFTFDYAAFPLPTPASLPDILKAIQSALDRQLGLKPVEAKVPVSALVIDRVERAPVEN